MIIDPFEQAEEKYETLKGFLDINYNTGAGALRACIEKDFKTLRGMAETTGNINALSSEISVLEDKLDRMIGFESGQSSEPWVPWDKLT